MVDTITEFAKNHVVTVLVICGVAVVVRRFLHTLTTKLIKRALHTGSFKSARDEELREDTTISIIHSISTVAVWVIASMLVLSEIGIDIAPLIAGAGVVGLAVGFGAQSLVKDVIAGMFVLLENQYRVGDIVEINKTVSGVVEQFTLRTTALRDLDGMLHHVPNGIIEIATNKTMDFARVNLDIGVAYDTDIDTLEKIVNQVGTDMAEDEEWGPHIQDAPQFRRIQEFGDSAILVKIVGKTEPIKQWMVTGELRRRLKKAFDENGIEIPFPQRVMHTAPKPSAKKKK